MRTGRKLAQGKKDGERTWRGTDTNKGLGPLAVALGMLLLLLLMVPLDATRVLIGYTAAQRVVQRTAAHRARDCPHLWSLDPFLL